LKCDAVNVNSSSSDVGEVNNVNSGINRTGISSEENDVDICKENKECASSGLTDVKVFESSDEEDPDATWTVVTKRMKKKQNKKTSFH
jgi:hypothetical protein